MPQRAQTSPGPANVLIQDAVVEHGSLAMQSRCRSLAVLPFQLNRGRLLLSPTGVCAFPLAPPRIMSEPAQLVFAMTLVFPNNTSKPQSQGPWPKSDRNGVESANLNSSPALKFHCIVPVSSTFSALPLNGEFCHFDSLENRFSNDGRRSRTFLCSSGLHCPLPHRPDSQAAVCAPLAR